MACPELKVGSTDWIPTVVVALQPLYFIVVLSVLHILSFKCIFSYLRTSLDQYSAPFQPLTLTRTGAKPSLTANGTHVYLSLTVLHNVRAALPL